MRLLLALLLFSLFSCQSAEPLRVGAITMDSIYDLIKTPYKYGVVFRHPDTTKMIDSPTIFQWEGRWFMTYIVFDGRGYETWLAESPDLLKWSTRGRLLSFTDAGWDAQQKAGYLGLLDINWDGTYSPQSYKGNYWMSYLGGSEKGYEAGRLGTGIAYAKNPTDPIEWTRLEEPVLAASDKDARWYDNGTIFKSTIIEDPEQLRGYPFLMFYNAAGDTANYESIAMAGSKDLKSWTRLGKDPIITKKIKGSICGDAQLSKMGNLYVLFYFGAFWPDRPGAFERFASSYDLKNWTEWEGGSLVESSEPYDETYAHKPMVINWKGTVYHFYNAVGKEGRVIALATSKPLKL